MSKKPDIICLSLFRTNNPFTATSLRISKVWAEDTRVFFINHPYSYLDYFKLRKDASLKHIWSNVLKGKPHYQVLPDIPKNFIDITPPITYPINWLPQGAIYNWMRKKNDRIIYKTIEDIKRKYDVKDYIFYNCWDPFFAGSLPKDLGARLSIYNCVDDISIVDYTKKHGVALELESVQNADITLCTSTQLLNKYKHHSPHCAMLQNAVDLKVIEKAVTQPMDKPKEWLNAKGRIFGFVGNLDPLRINYNLLMQLAKRFPNDTLALVGPINGEQFEQMGFKQLPNVIVSGIQPYEELPRYMQHMDVTMIPFLCNKLTESIYPLKINEYLGAGKPVVSTRFSVDIESFSEHIHLADNDTQFLDLLEVAAQENSPALAQKRLAIARNNTWEARAQQFWQIIKI